MFSGRILLIRFLAMLVAVLVGATNVQADVTNVTANPDPLRINTGGTALITVRWDVEVTLAGTAQKIVISSTNGRMFIDGMQVDIIGGPLSRVVTHNGGGTQIFTFRDRVRVSRTYAKLIGDGAVGDYRRTFDHTIYDVNNTGIAGMSPRSGGGALALRDVSIAFDDETLFRTVATNQPLRARAVISSAGEGRIDGSWEVAGPDGGEFRVISRVRQVLAGSRRTVFESPTLPTSRAGNYVVRFSPVQGSTSTAEIDEIRYVVAPGGNAVPLTLVAPRAGESASAGTPFQWTQVAGAASYRLEFREGGAGGVGNGERVAAVDLRATQTRLKPFTLARVRDRTPVFWRVVAYDGDGNVLATSPARQLGGGASSQSNN